jgi:hypothetical protein
MTSSTKKGVGRHGGGFTLAEVLICSVILLIGFMALVAAFGLASVSIQRGEDVTVATFLADEIRDMALQMPTFAGVLERSDSFPHARDEHRRDGAVGQLVAGHHSDPGLGGPGNRREADRRCSRRSSSQQPVRGQADVLHLRPERRAVRSGTIARRKHVGPVAGVRREEAGRLTMKHTTRLHAPARRDG